MPIALCTYIGHKSRPAPHLLWGPGRRLATALAGKNGAGGTPASDRAGDLRYEMRVRYASRGASSFPFSFFFRFPPPPGHYLSEVVEEVENA